MKQIVMYNEDCILGMMKLPDSSIDMVLADPPYGTTLCKWDAIIPVEQMWWQLRRVTKPSGAIVLTAGQPFTTILIAGNIEMFRYCWVWDKVIGTGFLNANKMPLKGFEDIPVFYKKLPTYNPQKVKGKPFVDKRDNPNKERTVKEYLGTKPKPTRQDNIGERHPRGIIRISSRNNSPLHPTQKPVPLMEYLVKTYTNEGDVVLDFAMGSGTTAVACINLNRRFIGFETEKKYYNIAVQRLEKGGTT